MRKLFVLLALLALAVTPAYADMGDADAEDLRANSFAVDTAPAYLVYFIGDDTTGVVTVTFADDLWTLKQAGAADTTIECPLSGAYGGLLDTTNAACDTTIELMNVVNTTAGSEWRIVPITSFKADDTDNLTLAAAAAEGRGDGQIALWDDSSALDHRVTFLPGLENTTDVTPLMYDPKRNGQLQNPFKGQTQVLKYAHYNITSSGTMTDLKATCVVPKFGPDNTYSASENVIYLEADATTGVAGLIDEFNYAGGGLRCKDGQIIVHLPTDTDLTVPVVVLTGYSEKN